MTKLELAIEVASALADLRKCREQAEKATNGTPDVRHMAGLGAIVALSETTSHYMTTLMEAHRQGVFDAEFPLLTRGTGSEVLVIRFEDAVLGVYDGKKMVGEVRHSLDVATAVGHWMESGRPSLDGVDVSRQKDHWPKLYSEIERMLASYKQEG